MAQKVNPISVLFKLNHSSNSSWFSDYYYGNLFIFIHKGRWYFLPKFITVAIKPFMGFSQTCLSILG